jgi:6-pyruvoyltetrahydropterin/6-carboxytetrahydropterin synthase
MEQFGVRVEKEAFNFACGHFLIFADGTREELHGHNYRVFVELLGELDAASIVFDFRKFKPIVKRLCDALDHRTLLPIESSFLTIEAGAESVEVTFGKDRMLFPRRDVILLPLANTSAELLARHFCDGILAEIKRLFPLTRIRSIEVGVEEGPGQMAFYRKEMEQCP